MLWQRITEKIRRLWRRLIYNVRYFFHSLAVDKNHPIGGFETIWKYGYWRCGDITQSAGYNSGLGGDLHEVYLKIVKPYITSETRALEIGAGRGGWTRGLLPAAEVWVLEAQPRWMTQIDEFLGYPRNLKYIQVKDFSCRELPDNYFDYLLSVGTFYFLSEEGRSAYLTNLFSKMKSGANCFIMFTDFLKYKNYTGHWPPEIGGVWGWKHNNKEMMNELLESIGWRVISPDLDLLKREVVVHFRKP